MTSLISRRTGFLFAQPSFGSGFARGLDLFGTFDAYNTVDSEVETDEQAIANDWLAVGDDLRKAYEQARSR